MTLYKVIETIKMLALKHPNVNGAYEGNIYDIMNANPKQKYASVVLTQQSHTQDNTYDHYNFNIFYVDRLVDNMEDNRVQIQSIGKSILSNIIKAFCDEFDAECENINYQTFTERFSDECAGVYATITIDLLKDIYCTEKYWDENWSAPVISIKNQNKKVSFNENGFYTIDYDPTSYTGLGNVEVEVNVPDLNGSYSDGYADGKNDGIEEQKAKLENITITENGTYTKEDGYNQITVNVPDVNGSYDEGYNDGIEEQKAKLESITITENGTYTKEDGYNQITVNVEDVNGSYDDGYNDGIEQGIENAEGIIAESAQVLDVTENGIYATKYTDIESLNFQITGYFADGTPFYDYAQLIDNGYRCEIDIKQNNRVEFWWKPDLKFSDGNYGNRSLLELKLTTYPEINLFWNNYNNCLDINLFNGSISYSLEEKWYNIVITKENSYFVIFINGEKIIDYNYDYTISGYITLNDSKYNAAQGYFGMLKVDNNIYIPTENGFINHETNIPLEVISDGSYFLYNDLKYSGGNLIKTVNVNIKQKINIPREKVKFAYSSIYEVPEWADFEGLTDMSYLFYNCTNLETIPPIDTSNVTDMFYTFHTCSNLKNIPQLDTSNVTYMERTFYRCSNLKTIPLLDFSKINSMSYLFYECTNLETIPQLNTSNVTSMNRTFYSCTNLKSLPLLNVSKVTSFGYFFGTSTITTLTDLGGFIGLKSNWNDNYGLKMLPNLTYESCINILNGLYDFTGNNETPTSSQGNLKVHANFLTTVGEEISIGTNKGWTITA